MTRRRRKPLGYVALQRFAISGCTERKQIYTNVVDALLAAKHISERSAKTCNVLHGMPGAESRIATCAVNKCKTPGGNAISMRKLYDAEQGVRPTGGKRNPKGRGIAVRATKTKLTQYERRQLLRKVKKGG